MNQDRTINAELKKDGEADILEFQFDNPIIINLNNSSNNELKEMFEILLKELLNQKFELKLIVKEDYHTDLYKEVCEEYIKALNEEIKATVESDLWKDIFEPEAKN